MFKAVVIILFSVFFYCVAEEKSNSIKVIAPTMKQNHTTSINKSPVVPCVCGIFLSGQLEKGKPKGDAIFMHEHDNHFMCNTIGHKQCIQKCLDLIVRHLANSPNLICGAIDRDCYKEKASLFIKNCHDQWVNSNLSAPREFCCKNGEPYKCPLL